MNDLRSMLTSSMTCVHVGIFVFVPLKRTANQKSIADYDDPIKWKSDRPEFAALTPIPLTVQ